MREVCKKKGYDKLAIMKKIYHKVVKYFKTQRQLNAKKLDIISGDKNLKGIKTNVLISMA